MAQDLGVKGSPIMSREIDSRDLFERFAKPGETYDEDDDEWMEGMQEAIRNEGDQVGRNEWDSGGPGAGAGVSYVYLFRGLLFSEDDVGMYGPFDNFIEAAQAVGLLGVNEATTSIWVDTEYRAEAESALEPFDGLSKEQASAIFHSG
jgi:hypothetical protein